MIPPHHRPCDSTVPAFQVHIKVSHVSAILPLTSHLILTMPLRTHLAALDATASLYPSRPVFKVPRLASPGSDEIEEWSSISYSQFKSDVDLYAKYWARTLAADGLPPRTTVGLWYVPSS